MAGSPLLRSLGLWQAIGLGINAVVGSGIFLLPGRLAAPLGPAGLAALVLAGLFAAVIVLCFAEVASRFEQTGGAYTYARAAFGPLIGFETGWMACLTALVAWAAMLNGLVEATSYFLPAAATPLGRNVLVLGVLSLLGFANLRGAATGAAMSNLAIVPKLATLAGFIVAGAGFVEPARFVPFAPKGWGELGPTVLLAVYAYVGFENLVVPAGEMKDPQRTLPRAILISMAVILTLYLGVETVTVGTLNTNGVIQNAVALAAESFLGPVGGRIIGAGVVASVFGVVAASAVILPRRFYAMAEERELPAALARVHPRWRTPWVAILVTYVITAALAMTGSFTQLALIAVVGRVVQYATTCLTLIALRRREHLAAPATFRLPFGTAFALLGVGASILLLANATGPQLLAGLAAMASGLPVYAWLRWRRASAP